MDTHLETRPSIYSPWESSSTVHSRNSSSSSRNPTNPAECYISQPKESKDKDNNKLLDSDSSSHAPSNASSRSVSPYRSYPTSTHRGTTLRRHRERLRPSFNFLPSIFRLQGRNNNGCPEHLPQHSFDSLRSAESGQPLTSATPELCANLQSAILDCSDAERRDIHSYVQDLEHTRHTPQWRLRKRDAVQLVVSATFFVTWVVCFALVVKRHPWLDRNPFAWRVGRFLPSYTTLYALTLGFSYALPKLEWWRRCFDTKLSRLSWHVMLNLVLSFVAIAVFWIDFWSLIDSK